MNIFEQATRKALRFPSNRGELSVEQLWSLPLTSKSGFDLDSVARSVNGMLKSVTEDSFVTTRENPAKSSYELQLDVVKHVIAVKLAEEAENKAASTRRARKAQLMELLAQKEQEELKGKTKEEILAEIEALG